MRLDTIAFFALGIVTIGIVLIITDLINISPDIPDSFKTLVKIGGAFISTLSGFQIKEIINRKEKIGIFETLNIRLSSYDESHPNRNKSESHLIEEIVWKTIEKINKAVKNM